MSKKIRKITADDVLSAAQKYRRSRRVNPTAPHNHGTVSFYTAPTNPKRHCLVGQIFTDLELPLPPEHSGVLLYMPPRHIKIEDRAIRLLGLLQLYADGAEEGKLRPWGSAVVWGIKDWQLSNRSFS